MTQWEGQSRGNVLGYRIFVFCLKHFGMGAAYFLLRFVALYFVFFSPKGTKAVHRFYRRLGHSSLKAYFKVYQNYYVFGQTILDKVAIASGLRNRFTYEFDGIQHLRDLLAQQQGGVLISAHIGNFEIADHFFQEIDEKAQINLVTTDRERRDIKEYLETVTSQSELKFIIIKDDGSHIFDIHAALKNNEIVCFTGDRYFEGIKTIEGSFLGKNARFPAGPFLLATRLKVPVIFVYVMKETNKHYHLYARTTTVKHRDAQDLLRRYIDNMEGMIKKYPLQWFNYFDFWNEEKAT